MFTFFPKFCPMSNKGKKDKDKSLAMAGVQYNLYNFNTSKQIYLHLSPV